jgi:hypothetical protein
LPVRRRFATSSSAPTGCSAEELETFAAQCEEDLDNYDLALISEVYVPWYRSDEKQLTKKAGVFFERYEQRSRSLGFSSMFTVQRQERLFPLRLNGDE